MKEFTSKSEATDNEHFWVKKKSGKNENRKEDKLEKKKIFVSRFFLLPASFLVFIYNHRPLLRLRICQSTITTKRNNIIKHMASKKNRASKLQQLNLVSQNYFLKSRTGCREAKYFVFKNVLLSDVDTLFNGY